MDPPSTSPPEGAPAPSPCPCDPPDHGTPTHPLLGAWIDRSGAPRHASEALEAIAIDTSWPEHCLASPHHTNSIHTLKAVIRTLTSGNVYVQDITPGGVQVYVIGTVNDEQVESTLVTAYLSHSHPIQVLGSYFATEKPANPRQYTAEEMVEFLQVLRPFIVDGEKVDAFLLQRITSKTDNGNTKIIGQTAPPETVTLNIPVVLQVDEKIKIKLMIKRSSLDPCKFFFGPFMYTDLLIKVEEVVMSQLTLLAQGENTYLIHQGTPPVSGRTKLVRDLLSKPVSFVSKK